MFLTSKPLIVKKQYDAARINTPKNIIMELITINIRVKAFNVFHLTSIFMIEIISIIKACNKRDSLVKLTSSANVWSNIFRGLNKILSKFPLIISLSKVSIPRKKVSQKAKPNWIIENVNKTSYRVNPLTLEKVSNKHIIVK